MDSQTIFAALRDALAELYPKEADAQVVVADAGLDAKRIAFSARAQTNWHHILAAAINEHRLDALLAVVNKAYGDNPTLRTACEQYQRFIEQGNHLESYPEEKASIPLDKIPAPGESPYKGLQFFDVNDAALFFGREHLTAELVNRLRHQRFLAVVGASGSGKSSVVRAGLVPALTKREPLADGTLPPDGYQAQHTHIITPTALPLESLASSLTREQESVTAVTTLADDLAKDPRSLRVYVRRLLEGSASADRLLLVVDQFEELFTLCRDKAQRQALVDNLLMATSEEGQVVVVITLRADFYAHCAEFDNLRQALEEHQKYIGPMSQAELHCAIEEPAHWGKWALEPGLVDLILADVGNEPGALPLLSHALLETWKRRQGRALTLAGYAQSGRIQGAIAKTAETVLHERLTTPEQQQIARNIFLRLTELGEGTQDTRRRVELSELMPTSEARPVVEAVLKTLVDARLVITFQTEAEVAHEALIREWPRLRTWLTENREWLRVQRRLTESAQTWEASGQHPDLLYRYITLEQTLAKVPGHETELTPIERHFLEESQKVIKVEAYEKKSAQQRIMLLWLLANILGFAVGGAVSYAMGGAIVGMTQWFFLYRSIPNTRWWLLANILGYALGFAVGGAASDVVDHALGGTVPLAVSLAVLGAVFGAMGGAVLGMTQWFFLHRSILNARWWLLANILGYALGFAVGYAVLGAMGGAVNGTVRLAVLGSVGGAVVGTIQWFFLRRSIS